MTPDYRLVWNFHPGVARCMAAMTKELEMGDGDGEDMDVRLAYHPEGARTLGECAAAVDGRPGNFGRKHPAAGTIRLALSNAQAERSETGGLGMTAEERLPPTVRLACNGMGQGEFGENHALKERYVRTEADLPAVLVSYVYLDNFLYNRDRYQFRIRDWVLDSGAFSAHMSGKVIDIDEFCDCALKHLAEDEKLVEVYALDVIGDWRASLKNTEHMWKRGIPAIPCYHFGEPIDVLKSLAKDYPKVALGGVARKKLKLKHDFSRACFGAIWPHRIHGFGFGHESSVMGFPFHSVDATNWELGPCGFGQWQAFGSMSVRGSNQNLRAEVEHYLKLERRASQRWKREFELLDKSPYAKHEGDISAPSCRLAIAGGSVRTRTRLNESGLLVAQPGGPDPRDPDPMAGKPRGPKEEE